MLPVRPASDILNEKALEEDIQKSADALLMPSSEDQPIWPDDYVTSASEILSEQAEEEAQY
ncbi:hypothetical protein OG21DRAFT_1490848 [Imleria badia]|nr:hypothetical protein OG21DRAFT_1490848 [Imleria badia]